MDLTPQKTNVNKIHKNYRWKKLKESRYRQKYGISKDGVINRFKRTIERRNERINKLVDIIRKHDAEVNELKKVFRRELKKKDTLYNKLQKRFDEFKQRKGERHRSIIHKVKYKTYEPTKKIEQFESKCRNAKQLHQDYLGILEHKLKTLKFLNEESVAEYGLTEDYLTVLLTLKILGVPSKIDEIVLDDMKKTTKRRVLTELEERLLIRRPTHRFYEITVLGDKVLNDYKNYLSYGKVETVEMLKKSSGLDDKKETDYDDI